MPRSSTPCVNRNGSELATPGTTGASVRNSNRPLNDWLIRLVVGTMFASKPYFRSCDPFPTKCWLAASVKM